MPLFQTMSHQPSEEERMQIAKTGVIPSHLKRPEDKLYMAILRPHDEELYSQLSALDLSIDGEVIIEVGRKTIFNKLKEFFGLEESFCSINVKTSTVLVEGVDANKGVSLYRFLELCNEEYPDEAIDPEVMEYYLQMAETDFNKPEAALPVSNETVTSGFGNAGTMLNVEGEESKIMEE